ncbi:MAG TPA: hypothetical protein VIV60_31195, partial [Polyangiaceae bacterium]
RHGGRASSPPVAAYSSMAPTIPVAGYPTVLPSVPVTQTTAVEMAAMKLPLASGGVPGPSPALKSDASAAVLQPRPRYEDVVRAPNAARPMASANSTPVRPSSNPVELAGTPGRGITPAAVRVAGARSSAVVHAPRNQKHNESVTSVGTGLARLGALAKRYPVGVFGGAAVGALLLGVFVIGLGQVLGLTKPQKRLDDSVVSRAQPTSGVPKSASLAVVLPSAASAPAVNAPPANPPAVNAIVARAASDDLGVRVAASGSRRALPEGNAAIEAASDRPSPVASKPLGPTAGPQARDTKSAAAATERDVTAGLAMGHLFAGRLPEAEHAYRELLARYPEDNTYAHVVRILARHNGPDCRPGNPIAKACPTVKP